MRFAILITSACTLGGAARFEVARDRDGTAFQASLEPGAGITKLADGTTAAHEDAIVAMMRFGVGWGTRGLFGTVVLDVAGVPANGGFGATGGVRMRYYSKDCIRVSFGAGITSLVAQLHADDRVDQFGPNPRVSRLYHDATAFVGLSSCDHESALAGVAYELALADLLFAPGP